MWRTNDDKASEERTGVEVMMKMKTTAKTTVTAAVLAVLFAGPAAAQLNEDAVEFTEHLGEYVPGDITLRDETGQPVVLSEFVDRPTIVSMVYFECPGICTPLLNEVADILGKSNLDPDKQPFQLVSISFEPKDTPEMARLKQENYLNLVGRELPKDTWRFFTADQENIDKMTTALGFAYKRAGKEYTHPGGLVILSPDRKIVRYLYGLQFLPFDFQMGVYEASQGKVRPTTARLLNFCFSYDPEGRTYVFNLARVIGTVMLISIVFFIGFLVFTTRGKRGKEALPDGR
ncbi:MAG: SCO family protein [Candidatus Krumholzibacteriota bacterium]